MVPPSYAMMQLWVGFESDGLHDPLCGRSHRGGDVIASENGNNAVGAAGTGRNTTGHVGGNHECWIANGASGVILMQASVVRTTPVLV